MLGDRVPGTSPSEAPDTDGWPTIQLVLNYLLRDRIRSHRLRLSPTRRLSASHANCIPRLLPMFWPTGWIRGSHDHLLKEPRGRLKKKRGGSNKCPEWEKQEDNKAMEKKGTGANNIKIILKISPNLKFFFLGGVLFVLFDRLWIINP